MVTNPYCCAIPRTNGEHVVLDFATSAIAIGKVRVAFMKGQHVQEGALMLPSGEMTTDPRAFFDNQSRAILVPFGLHKGGGLQLLCELLGGGLAGLWTMQPGSNRGYGAAVNNMLTIAIDPDAFGDRAAFEAECEAMLDYVHSTEPATGIDRVRIPGEPERESMAQRLADGIDIDDNTWGQIKDAAASVGLEHTALA
jgi:uncharacterized oxidoreductase